jgi:hypothetical protein
MTRPIGAPRNKEKLPKSAELKSAQSIEKADFAAGASDPMPRRVGSAKCLATEPVVETSLPLAGEIQRTFVRR